MRKEGFVGVRVLVCAVCMCAVCLYTLCVLMFMQCAECFGAVLFVCARVCICGLCVA